MIPAKTDPRWKKIVQNPEAYKDKVSSLATKMLFSGLKIKKMRSSEDELIEAAIAFFKKNERIVANDIKMLFN